MPNSKLTSIFDELGFSEIERSAFLKSIEIVRESQSEGNNSIKEKIMSLVKEVMENVD